jgi:hypothetical protein
VFYQNIADALSRTSNPAEVLLFLAQTTSVCGTFFSFLHLGERKFLRPQFFILIITVVLSVFLAFSVGNLHISREEVNNLTAHTLVKLPPDAERTMPVENRGATLIAAKGAYLSHGKITEYISTDGVRLLYSPTEKDIGERDRLVEALIFLDLAKAQASRFPMEMLISFLLAALLGYCAGIYRRSPR